MARKKETLRFGTPPVVAAWAAAGGKKESEGPLASDFDFLTQDAGFCEQGCENWEQAESLLQRRAAELCLRKADLPRTGVDIAFAGDLQAQCTASNYTMRELGIPFAGVYGACSTMAETLARRAAEYEKGAKGQFGIKPDLLLIDGGRGQVSAVQAALAGTQLADVPMFGMVKDMDERGKIVNIAFAVPAAFVFGDHLGFTAGYDAAMLGPVIAAKLTGGVLAVLAALLFTRKKPAQNM